MHCHIDYEQNDFMRKKFAKGIHKVQSLKAKVLPSAKADKNDETLPYTLILTGLAPIYA